MSRAIIDLLEEGQAEDIVLLDVSEVTIIADYFVICSASSQRQIRALADNVSRELKGDVGRPLAVEGEPDSGWVLVDYGDVIVHIFMPEVRRLYDLETFWKNAKTVVRIQ